MHSDSKRKHVRVVLYLTPLALERLTAEAAGRAERSGVDVTPEAAARALLYAAVGLSADGMGDAKSTPFPDAKQRALDAFGDLAREMGKNTPGVGGKLRAHLKRRGVPLDGIEAILAGLELNDGR